MRGGTIYTLDSAGAEVAVAPVTSVAGKTGAVTLVKADITDLGTIGTAAALNVPASGNAAAGEVVKGSDSRLSDARTPVAHATSHQAGGSDPLLLDRLTVTTDDRAVATTPNDYNDTLVVRFRQASTLGVPSASTFVHVMGFRAWADSSGGEAHELAYADDGVWHRSGSTTTWGGWVKVMHDTAATIFEGDARLSDARTPTAHGHAQADVTNLVTDLAAKAARTANLVGFGQLEAHGTYTDFNAITDFGFHYVQGTLNGPGIAGGLEQYYCLSLSLGSEYAYSQYVCQIAWKRNAPGTMATRYREGGTWGSWATVGGGSGSTRLALTTLTATGQNSATNGTSTTADAHASLTITFTAPASGSVVVILSGAGSTGNGQYGYWSLREGTTNLAGTERMFTNTGTSQEHHRTIRIPISGLTPGNSYTYKWAHRGVGNTPSATLHWGTGNGEFSGNFSPYGRGVLMMEVWSA